MIYIPVWTIVSPVVCYLHDEIVEFNQRFFVED